MSDPDHTAARLVAAAERLFAAGGEESTSLRAITREARSNAAAVHYHFGGRDELLRAVVDRHLGPLADRRAQLLDQAAARHGEPVPVAAVIGAALRPDLELLATLRIGQVQVARLLGRAHTLPGVAVADLMERRFDVFVQQVLPMLRPSLPDVDEVELWLRLRLVVATVVSVFAAAPDPGRPGPLGSDDVDEQLARLVAFCAGGLSAAASISASTTRSGTTRSGTTQSGTTRSGTARKSAARRGATRDVAARNAEARDAAAKKTAAAKTGAAKGDKKRKKH